MVTDLITPSYREALAKMPYPTAHDAKYSRVADKPCAARNIGSLLMTVCPYVLAVSGRFTAASGVGGYRPRTYTRIRDITEV